LRLASFRELFASLPIKDEVTTTPYTPLYRRILGEDFNVLPEPVRALHDLIGDSGAAGSAMVTRGKSRLALFIGAMTRFPPEGRHRVHVTFEEENGVERWTRRFSDHRFSSEMSQEGDRLVERFGPVRFLFNLRPDPGGLRMVLVKWTAFGIPLPLALGPRTLASEQAEGSDFLFDVSIALPWIGHVIHYTGRLRRLS
jgi:hypothetical protein